MRALMRPNDMPTPPGLIPHTVEGPNGGRLAGFLVRDPGTLRELGYIWPAGATWRWKTPTGEHFGERATERAAVQVLVDIALAARHAALSVFPARSALSERIHQQNDARPLVVERAKREPVPTAPEPQRHIVWPDDSPDLDPASLTSAITAALRRHQR
jgi:hypothetical protein